ncbi:MAG: 4-hydroxythreonine-4-phosphate dehydrogenase PdxA [Pseudobdellovibrio sp.]
MPISKYMMTPYKKIALTSGDSNGIGFEVSAKALAKIPASVKKNKCVFFLFRHKKQEKTQSRYFKLIDERWLRLTFTSLGDALSFINSAKKNLPDNVLIDLSLVSSEAAWVVEAALACKHKLLDSLVTGPLSKKKTAALPNKPLGHTGIFRDIFPDRKFFMSFVGKDFNVILNTDHVPLSQVESLLQKNGLRDVLQASLNFRKLIKSKKPVAVLGFNPHAGESGLIGLTEKKLFARLPKGINGPLVPDAAFLKKNWCLYSVFVCLYHDQGLIPFKMHHGQDSGVHLTLGLPFIRTSVDHGTANDLFNKNVANSSSMLDAIKLVLKLTGV